MKSLIVKHIMKTRAITYSELITNAEHLLAQSNYTEALLEFNDAIEMKSDDPSAYYLRGSIKNILKDKNEAKADKQKSIELGADINRYFIKLSDLA